MSPIRGAKAPSQPSTDELTGNPIDYSNPANIPLDELEGLHTPTEDDLPFGIDKYEGAEKAYKAIVGSEPSFDLPAYMDKTYGKKPLKEKPTQELGIQYFDLLTEVGDMEWLVKGWLAKRDIALLAGRAGCGKSTTAAELAVALAGGRNGEGFLGIPLDKTVPVIYLDEEAGKDDLIRLFRRLGIDKEHPLPNLHVASCVGLRLDNDESIQKIEHEIKDKNPGLIILDTASHFFGDADENNAADVARMFKPLFRLREEYGSTFLIIHHLRKAPSSYGGAAPTDDLMDRVRGSSAFTTQASTVWTASQSTDGGYVDLAIQKRRGGRKTSMRIQYHEVDNRITLMSAGEPERFESELDRCSRFIVASMESDMREIWRTCELLNHAEKNGYSKRTFEAAKSHLTAVGVITMEKQGKYFLSKKFDASAEFPQSFRRALDD